MNIENKVIKFPTEEVNIYETCVVCHELTDVEKKTPIGLRVGYVEGAGQTHPICYNDAYSDENLDEINGQFGEFLMKKLKEEGVLIEK